MDEQLMNLVRKYVETNGDDWEDEHKLAFYLYQTEQTILLGPPASSEIHRWRGFPEGLQEFSGLYELHHACKPTDNCPSRSRAWRSR